MFGYNEASFRRYKQGGFLVSDPAPFSGNLIPGDARFNVKRTRKAIANTQVQADGIEREFANGNSETKSDNSTSVVNFNYLGHDIRAIAKTFASTAFDGVYSIAVTSAGSGLTSALTATIANTGTTQAKCVPIVYGGQLAALVVTDPGTGYAAAPAITFGGVGGGVAPTATANLVVGYFRHEGTLGPGTPFYYLIEKGVTGFWRRYPNLALGSLDFEDQVEGICTVATTWTGTGHVFKGGTPLDSAPVEITGTPGEYANLAILEADAFGGVIMKVSSKLETTIKEKRVPDGLGGFATQLKRTDIKVTCDGSAYFEDNTLLDKMDNGTKTKIQCVTTSPDGIFTKIYPQVKFEVDDWERDQNDGLIVQFKGHSINASPTLRLINQVSSY